jgi:hypothetical protein
LYLPHIYAISMSLGPIGTIQAYLKECSSSPFVVFQLAYWY